jgi:phytoene dehydrogenase-like protein
VEKCDTDNIVIIGGGIAGLACGCYLQMNGYRTEILEFNPIPGGLCMSWDRGPYVFDGCLRWLVGTLPSSAFHQVWTELGAIAGRAVTNYDEFLRVEGRGGEVLSVSADLDRFSRDCKRLAPEDARLIEELVAAARRCAPLEPPLDKPLELMNPFERTRLLFRYLPMLLTLAKWKNIGMDAYFARYQNPFLRESLRAIAGDGRMSALVLVMVLAFRSCNNAGYVAGGSRAFAEAIAARYTGLGGIIRYNTRVVSVSVQAGRAAGVKCAGGASVPAGTVVSCADGHTTIFELLEGRFVSKAIRFAYETCDVFPGMVQASLGINRTFPDAPQAVSIPLARPLKVDDSTKHDRIEVAVFGADSELCPAGKSIMIVRFSGHHEYWTRLKAQRIEAYREAKKGLLKEIIAVLEQRFPGVEQHLENADLATPATFVRYTGNWQASYQGWLPTPRILGRRLPHTLPGLDRFYMAGHWVEPGGGLPSAALSGRYTAQMICARDRKVFTATSSS